MLILGRIQSFSLALRLKPNNPININITSLQAITLKLHLLPPQPCYVTQRRITFVRPVREYIGLADKQTPLPAPTSDVKHWNNDLPREPAK